MIDDGSKPKLKLVNSLSSGFVIETVAVTGNDTILLGKFGPIQIQELKNESFDLSDQVQNLKFSLKIVKGENTFDISGDHEHNHKEIYELILECYEDKDAQMLAKINCCSGERNISVEKISTKTNSKLENSTTADSHPEETGVKPSDNEQEKLR
jgi:hypothetical protein